MSRIELLFEREATLRMRALDLADWERGSLTGDGKPPHAGRTNARKALRLAALAYADLVREIEDDTEKP